jgi:Skp family chaperone for outer membrane proteins
MAEQSRDNQKRLNTKDSKKRMRLIAYILIIACFGLLLFFIIQYKTVEQQLAAIDAARVIPDTENAAILYNQLRKDYNDIDLPFHFVYPSDPARMRPWFSKELPEIAKWYEERQEITAKLLQINKYEKCRFPILKFWKDFSTTTDRLRTMRVMAVYLIRLANNDIAENRIEQGLEKYICAIRIGRHYRQCPFIISFTQGISIESLALARMRYCILHSDLTEKHLQIIKKALTQSNEEQTQNWENMIEVENLYAKQTPLLHRLKRRLENWQNQRPTFDVAHEIRTRLLADRRGNQILILLRNYKDKMGHWPQNLEELQFLADKESLIDPQNNGPFVYKTTEDDFILYGRGPNKIDEGGRFHLDGGDDYAIWPRKIPQTKEKNAGTD